MTTLKLLDNVSVDTDGTPDKGLGQGMGLTIWATSFGGGAVNIELSPDNGVTWVLATYGGNPASFTSNITKYIVKIGQGQLIRATLTGSSGASNVNAMIFQ